VKGSIRGGGGAFSFKLEPKGAGEGDTSSDSLAELVSEERLG
jgi:hypothetical protein